MIIPNISHPFSKAGQKIESKIRKAIFEFKMVKNIDSIAIALSGGKDSITLLYMLKAILANGFKDIKIIAIHIDGEFSCGASVNRNFLKKICDSLNIEFFFDTIEMDIKKGSCYSCSRMRRKKIFELAKKNSVKTIAFGHHKDDNIQTLLLNLFHKGEFEGMNPLVYMKNFDVTIVRPMIYVDEDEIISFANANNFLKIMCKCPIGANSKRKDIQNILQNLEKIFPNIKNNLSISSFIYSQKKALNP